MDVKICALSKIIIIGMNGKKWIAEGNIKKRLAEKIQKKKLTSHIVNENELFFRVSTCLMFD